MNAEELVRLMGTGLAVGAGLAVTTSLIQRYSTGSATVTDPVTRVAVAIPPRLMQGGKSWRKAVTGVDTSQHTGYAFLSDLPNDGFVPHGKTVMLPVGCVLLAYDDEGGKPYARAVKIGEAGVPVNDKNEVQYLVTSRDVKWADAIKADVGIALVADPLYRALPTMPSVPKPPEGPKGFEGVTLGAPNEELVRKLAEFLWDLSNHPTSCPEPKDCRDHFRQFQMKAEDLMIQWVDFLGSMP